jgi:hypothetical protein
MNLFQPINVNILEVAWYGNEILWNLNCKYFIPRVLKIIKYLLSSELNDFSEKSKNIDDLCNSKSRNLFMLGHTSVCYAENCCSSILLFLTSRTHHFPSVQELLCLYKIRRVQIKDWTDWDIHNININMLLEIEQLS